MHLRDAMAADRPKQGEVDCALCGYFDAVEGGDSAMMLRTVAVVASAGEQQVQRALLFVQRLRHVSRGELLGVLTGSPRRARVYAASHSMSLG